MSSAAWRRIGSSTWCPRSPRSQEKLHELRRDVYRNLTPIQRVQVARSARRPFTLDYLRLAFTDFIELHGDRAFRDDPSIVGGWARLDDETVMVIGHQRGRDTKENLHRNFGMPHPEGYRKALRLMKLAEKFHVPDPHLHRHAGRLGRARRRGARPVRGDRTQPPRDEPAHRADRRDGHRRGRLRRRARPRRRRPRADARELRLLGDHRRGVRGDPLEGRQEPGDAREGRRRAQDHRPRPARAQGRSTRSSPSPSAARTPTTRRRRRTCTTRCCMHLDELRRLKPDKLVRRRREKYLKMGAFEE